jgi:hypothetical protein
VRTRDFGELMGLSRSLLYDPARAEGLVFYTVGGLCLGKVGIVCLGRTRRAAEEVREQFVHLAGARHPATTPVEVS